MNQSMRACGQRARSFTSSRIVGTTSPTADGLTSRMREKFSVTSDAAFTPNTGTFRLRGENLFQRCRKPMTGLFAADDVFTGDPIELNHAPLAAERFVSMPGVLAALESQQRT